MAKKNKKTKRPARRKDLFQRAGLTMEGFKTVTTVLAIVSFASGDEGLKRRCKAALIGLRKLKRLIKER